jgi:hypothetical protein
VAFSPLPPPSPHPSDLSILEALCGLEGIDASAAAAAAVEEEQSDDEDDEDSFDGDGQPRKKRARRTRTELNEIEKQRTRRINEQIQSLRALLEASGLNTKKDKFSILKKYVQGGGGREGGRGEELVDVGVVSFPPTPAFSVISTLW